MNHKSLPNPTLKPAADITEFDDRVFSADAWRAQAERDQKCFHASTPEGIALAKDLLTAAKAAYKQATDARDARIALLKHRGDEPWSYHRIVQ